MNKVICVCGTLPRYIWHTLDEKKPTDVYDNPLIRSIICHSCGRHALGSFKVKEDTSYIEVKNKKTGKPVKDRKTGKNKVKEVIENLQDLNSNGTLKYNHNDTARRWNKEITKMRKVLFPDGLPASMKEREKEKV